MQPFHPVTRARPSSPPLDSPSAEKESHHGSEFALRKKQEDADNMVQEYEQQRDRVAAVIEGSEYLAADMRNFNRSTFRLRYPTLTSTEGPGPTRRPGMYRRTLTFADEPSSSTDVILSASPAVRQTIKRSLTLAPQPPVAPIITASTSSTTMMEDEDDFSILRLDLNLGATRQTRQLISQLEKSSISALLDTRLESALGHLALLQKRIHDSQSRVLVTGDLNAGKSTLVNALLRRGEVMPTDEQPLTTRFVEVVSAKENNGRTEIHVLDQHAKYNSADPASYTIESVDRLASMATELSADAASPPLRVFLDEASDPSSILHNGVVDISLIDAPGLNRDSIKTTANFARQEEIDVVIFVVSAANHFTLSAKEFIWQAGHEKAHLFIVVNRFDQIRDKERCRRTVLEQIRLLSPNTYEDAADLVHFVDSAKVAQIFADGDSEVDEAFTHLERSLRSFVLVNRAKSKLGPAQNYLSHLLADVELLASANTLVAKQDRETAEEELARVKPVLEGMRKGKDTFEDGLAVEEDQAPDWASQSTKAALGMGLERVGRGQLAASGPALQMPSYPGILGIFDYARDARQAFLFSLDFAVRLAEDEARRLTVDGVTQVLQLADKHLPPDIERSRRVFNPSAMFSASRRPSSVVFAGLGVQPHLINVSVSDIFDLHHHLFVAQSSLPESSSRDLIPFTPQAQSLGLASLGFATWSFVSHSQALQPVLSGAIRLSEFAAYPGARRWIGPVIGLATLGAVAYVIYDLPNSIPRNVGRHLQSTLLLSSGSAIGSDDELVAFSDAQATRISREVRKVMRIAAYDVRERFKRAVDTKAEVVKESEEKRNRSGAAEAYFKRVIGDVDRLRTQLEAKD